MNEVNEKDNKSFEYETNNLIRSNFDEKEEVKDLLLRIQLSRPEI